ncbi:MULTISPECIES: IS3 family transposase [Bacillus]|uniref:IS3 family transposase n=1 Tax=Bacillus TaxID=1386 RepID=UPI0032F0892F
MKQIKIVLDNYILHYNRKKIKVQLKGMSPVQYRTHIETAANFLFKSSGPVHQRRSIVGLLRSVGVIL